MPACCFTGHRPDKLPCSAENRDQGCIELENKILSAVTKMLNCGITDFYCGGAMGFDLIAAEIVLIFRERRPDINLIMALPCVTQAKNYTDYWKEKYRSILAKADEVVYVRRDYCRGCYHERNKFMVDRSEKVIAFWDGSEGGTAYTVNYANKQNREVVNLCDDAPKQYQNMTIFELYDEP